jgi:16S rRNA (cytosine967-C5)-methyltransferase
LQPEEGETVVAEALRRHPDLQRLKVNPAEFGLPEAARTKAGDLRTLPAFWPETGGMDGFFAARLQRK